MKLHSHCLTGEGLFLALLSLKERVWEGMRSPCCLALWKEEPLSALWNWGMSYLWISSCTSHWHLDSTPNKNGSLTINDWKVNKHLAKMEKPTNKSYHKLKKKRDKTKEFQLFKLPFWSKSNDNKAASSLSKSHSCKHTTMLANHLVLFSSHLCLPSLTEELANRGTGTREAQHVTDNYI